MNPRFGLFVLLLAVLAGVAHGAGGPRARDLGVPFDGTPGPLNALTDVAGVEVGHTTLIAGDGAFVPASPPCCRGAGIRSIRFSRAGFPSMAMAR
jgi:hypothetical protein